MMDPNLLGIQGLLFSSQNVNSLNLSTFHNNSISQCKFSSKIVSILSKSPDVAFLQDVRLKNKAHILHNFIRCTKYGNYKAITNSDMGSGGVAILYNSRLDLEIISTYKSPCQNILLLDCRINSSRIVIGSIYGPRTANNNNFMKSLHEKLLQYNSIFLIGGDFNMVQSAQKCSDLSVHPSRQKYKDNNIEICHMRTIPNLQNSLELINLLANESLIDPFRFKNPHLKEFSYVPFSQARNRSRIDFFLLSKPLMTLSLHCTYLPTNRDIFDHKYVILDFKSPRKNIPPKIDSSLLNIPGNWESGVISAVELFAAHEREALLQRELQDVLQDLLSVRNQLCDIVTYSKRSGCTDKLLDQRVEDLQSRFSHCLDLLPSFRDLSENINICPSLFYETLVNNIKNDVCSFQKRLRDSERELKNKIIKDLNLLKSNNDSLLEDVLELEHKLYATEERIIRAECEKLYFWQVLNCEKPSRQYCLLNKGTTKRNSLGSIQKPDGGGGFVDFNSESERQEFINNFYKDLYNNATPDSLSIDDFLGDEIYNSDYVREKKLTIEESLELEGPLTVFEVNKSLKKCKKRSAPGEDGWCNRSIEHFWNILKYPLVASFNNMTENESLSLSFSRVNIRLIPKKGQLNKIGNWRPISLLSCHYKLCSSAINRRLTHFNKKLIGIRQKAYSSNCIAQECIMNIIDSIKKGIVNNSNLAVIACDFRKAFDLLDHKFILKVLEFFNFGPHLRKMCKTILTGRIGSIIFDQKSSTSFNFKCGSGQGDAVSATFFNLAQEILLIFLKESNLIERITINKPIANQTFVEEKLSHSSYADDLTEFIHATKDNLNTFKIVFNRFSLLSGLQLNLEKTTVIPIAAAANNNFRMNALNLGFGLDNEFTVLGFKIDNKLTRLRENIVKIKQKMTAQADFWKKFKMTIFGRLNMAKTFLISQISYIAPVLSLTKKDYSDFDDIILNFIKHDNGFLAEKKIFIPKDKGGLGMFNSESFVLGLRLGIFKRSLTNTDTWSECIKISRLTQNNPFSIDLNHPIYRLNPSAKLIASAFVTFLPSFHRCAGNAFKSPLFNNVNFFRLNGLSCGTDLLSNPSTDWTSRMRVLRPFDIVNPNTGQIVSKEAIELRSNLILTENDYNILCDICSQNRRQIGTLLDLECTDIGTFFIRILKGSKKYRNILDSVHYAKIEAETKINKALDILDRPPTNFSMSGFSKFYKWSFCNFLSHSIRLRLLKLLHGGLKLNNQTCHLPTPTKRYCYHCKRSKKIEIDENWNHLLRNCDFFHNSVKIVGSLLSLPFVEEKDILFECFLTGSRSDFNAYNELVNLAIVLFWDLFMKKKNLTISLDRPFLLSYFTLNMFKLYRSNARVRKIISYSFYQVECPLNNVTTMQQNLPPLYNDVY